ncbi:MAG: hypothetical protein Q4B31_00630 [Clostridia bacterium]|nr:hypothetical protein [Clostridia bacterium]
MFTAIGVYAENEQADNAQNQVPAEERIPGERQGRQRPNGENLPVPPEGMEFPEGMPEMPEKGEFTPPEDTELTPPQNNDETGIEENFDNPNFQRPSRGDGNPVMQNGNFEENMQNQTTEEKESYSLSKFIKEYQTPIISIVLLIIAFVFVKLYKRKNY